MKTIDIVVPCYNEEDVLEMFYRKSQEIYEKIEGYSFNYIFVNDGSRDNTYHILRSLAGEFSNIQYISFSRNFGKEAAVYAGLCHSYSDYCILMDADLQHPPSLVPEMIKKIEEGYDCCAAMRKNRDGESKIKSMFSSLYYKISNKITDVDLTQNATDFRIMSHQMIENIVELKEKDRFAKGLFAWVGYETAWISYENVERIAGDTKWSFKSLFTYALTGITSFSVYPLKFVTVSGLFISLMAFLGVIVTLIRKFFLGINVSGFASIMIAIFFLGGFVEFSIGILGEYISKIYIEAKDRPIYIIKETNCASKKDAD